MKLTKLVHSCLLVETSDRIGLFDPGAMSKEAIQVVQLERLDDIIVTHEHFDHMDIETIKQLKNKFPSVRLMAPGPAAQQLQDEGLDCTTQPVEGIEFFGAPHEPVEPLFPTPENWGVHYLDKLTHPGDSHHFEATKAILALPVTAPWGATVNAVNLARKLRPSYVIPIHDWHWSDEAQQQMYNGMSRALERDGITFIKAVNGESFEIEV